jgi:D-sedoheptulose 7-phosphate isomerase
MDKETIVTKQIEESVKVKEQLKGETKTLIAIAEVIVQAFREGRKVILFGNGGSAADAQHIAAELSGKFIRDRSPLPAIALTTNSSSLTAIANDYGYDSVFARQLQPLADKGDVVVGISTSGNSPNVLLAMEQAKRCGAITIAFTGRRGKLKDFADYVLSVPSVETPRIQEAHITLGHIICYLVEEELFGEGKK